MKRFTKVALIISFIMTAGCSVLLKSNGKKSDTKRLIFSDTDTLVFSAYQKKYKIDSVTINDNVYNIGQSTFYFPLNHLDGGVQKLRWSFHLSNGKTKKIEKELLIVADAPPEIIQIESYIKIPHNTSLFTQGLEFHKGVLYESAGKYGESTINKINHITGEIIKQENVDSKLFAEGLTFVNDTILMLTWKEGQILRFDTELNQLTQKDYHREGWGLCYNDEHLIASDGSDLLYFLKPHSHEVAKQITVYNDRETVCMINELEWVNGFLLANILGKDYVVVIEPESGKVIYQIDFSEIIKQFNLWSYGAFNGIAFEKKTGKLYFTGKNWPYYFVSYLPIELQNKKQ